MVKARELKLPLWQDLIYMMFVFVGPVIITCLELFQSHSSTLKWSFASIGSLLIVLIITKKYIFNSTLNKYKQEIFNLEHDYSIATGDDNLIIAKWRKYNLILYSINAISILLSTILVAVFVQALSDGLIAFAGAAVLILFFVIVGMIFKLSCYIFVGNKGDKDEKDN